MVDLRPLLFANALLIMLLVTAGFATIQRSPDLVGSELGDPGATTAAVETPVSPTEQPRQGAEPRTEEKPAEVADAEPAFTPSPVALPEPEPEPAPEPEPEPKFGTLVVQSNVSGDTVTINGRARGSTNLELELEPGNYDVVVSKSGHETWRDRVQVRAGQNHSLSARLQAYTTVEYRDGTWKHGVVTGEGTYRDSDGLRYTGEFVNRDFHGEGVAHYPDGRVYDGEWSEGRKHGQGELRLANGDVYNGEFRRDQYHGQGTLTTNNGDIYSGTFANGRMSGSGTLTSEDGTLYVGEFRNGQFHGQGTLTFPSGRHYEGQFANNRYHGRGVETFTSGRRYEGQFVEGKFHGQGKLRHPNGGQIESTFRDGKPYGQVRLTTPEGEIFTARTSDPGVCYRENSYRATQCPPMEGW